MDVITLTLAKNYANALVEGMGAIKGANCTISSIVKTGKDSVVTFEWTDNSGVSHTDTMTVKDGVDAVQISDITVTEDNRIKVVMADGTEYTTAIIPTIKGDKGDKGDRGEQGIQGEKGDKGDTPIVTASATVDSNVGTPSVTVTKTTEDDTTNFAFDFENIKGEQGADGFAPVITVAEETPTSYKLNITTATGTTETPNLKGADGEGSTLSELGDVRIVSVQDGQALVYDALLGKWKNGQSGTVIEKLSDIGDVLIIYPENGDVLQYDATTQKWVCKRISATPTQNSNALITSGGVFDADEVIWGSIGDLSHLTTTAKTDLVSAVSEVDTLIKNTEVVKQYTTMPLANENPQKVVQYVGISNANYTQGYFYYSNPTVESGTVVYNWVQMPVQPDNSDYESLTSKPQINDVELVGHKTSNDLGLADRFQYTTLPTPTNAIVGKICEYIGSTTADFKTGYFYQCVYDTDSAGYIWKNVDVSNNAELNTRVSTLETNQGDMSALEVSGANDIVTALNILAVKGIKSITYAEPYLIITLQDNSTYNFDITTILQSTQIGELANVLDTNIANGDLLQYDTSISKYKPYNIVNVLATLLQNAKDYTDQQIASAVQEDAFICDNGHKPTCTYDSSSDQYIVVYYQNNTLKTTTAISSRFYYKDNNGDPYCVSWFVTGDPSVDPIEFLYLVSAPDFDDYVNKNTDITNTYTPDMIDKTKVPNIASLDALYTLVATALSEKSNVSDIVDSLLSDNSAVPLSAKQGKVLKGLVDEKQSLLQVSVMPQCTQQMVANNVVLQYIGTSSQAYKRGYWYEAKYNETDDIYYWSEIKYSSDMVEITTAEVDNLWN